MSYTHRDIDRKLVQEIDLNDAYYTVAYKIIPSHSQYPIFTAADIWEQHSPTDPIRPLSYYLLSSDTIAHLMRIFPGFYCNIIYGFVLQYFLDLGRVQLVDIEAHRHSKLLGNWDQIRDRIEQVMAEDGASIKDFRVYVGCLGRSFNSSCDRVEGLDVEENLGDGWEPFCLDQTIQMKQIHRYRYLNMVNVYNHIVGNLTLFMLKTAALILRKHPGARLIKMKTDSIGLDRKFWFVPEHFKVVKLEDMKTKFCSTNIKYFDWTQLRDESLEELRSVCTDNITYFGAPGTGKTTTVKNNHAYDFACSSTNVCSLNIGGTTLFKELGLYTTEQLHQRMKKFRNKTVWVDEFSMVASWIWSYFAQMAICYKTRFIFSGDINQLPPVGESKINPNAEFFRIMFGRVTHLTVDHRNDVQLVNFREAVLQGDPPITESETDIEDISRHLVYTNRCKDWVNLHVLHTRKLQFTRVDQQYEVSIGVRLQPRVTVKAKEFYKGDLWEVIGVNTLRNLNNGKTRVIDNADYRYLGLGFAMTTHSAQGLTVEEPMMIHQSELMLEVDRSLLYTAVTRSRSYDNLHFAPTVDDHIDLAPIEYEPLLESKFDVMDTVYENLF
jgi:hypothetical protein